MSDQLFEKPEAVKQEIESFEPANAEELEQFRIEYLGSKGKLKDLFAAFKGVPDDQKKAYGRSVNEVKHLAEEKLQRHKAQFEAESRQQAGDQDLTLPANFNPTGSRHPINIVRNRIIDILGHIGFRVSEGPEIEDDWHNFTALNFPPDHPARDMQDTFFVTSDRQTVLRTHTSPVQIRQMENRQPPFRIISPGRVYRSDNDATHSPVFHQVEGLYVAKGVSFADLKQTLYYFVNEMFGEKVEVRFRPSYFPFTEPSAEMDIAWSRDGKKEWMEIMGCGMVDPNVLENCNIDSKEFTGFAFGMGVERIAMLKYGIRDIRAFYENDVRFLGQFRSA